MRTKKNYLTLYALLIMCSIANLTTAQVKITDTIYYNRSWQICEKPMASFFRIGMLAALDNLWFFVGNIKDYKIDNTILMESQYSDKGLREGDFKFYFQSGILMAEGKCKQGKMSGNWHWYYANGKEQAEIYFPEDDQQFQMIKYNDENGNITLQNGTGDFIWYTNPFERIHSSYLVKGGFTSGKRTGNWHFDNSFAKEDSYTGFTEKYNDKGNFVRVVYDRNAYASSGKRGQWRFQFSPDFLFTTENMEYDNIFKINGDSTTANALVTYLVEQKLTEVNLRYKVFDTAFATILRTLDRYSSRITKSEDFNSKIEFKIGSKGYLENISFTGNNLDSVDKIFIPYLLGKFKYVEMPGDKNVGIETNFTIYYYLIDFEEFVPGNVSSLFTKRIIFSFKSREKMLEDLRAHKKEIKQMFIDNTNYYYHYYRRH